LFPQPYETELEHYVEPELVDQPRAKKGQFFEPITIVFLEHSQEFEDYEFPNPHIQEAVEPLPKKRGNCYHWLVLDIARENLSAYCQWFK
jgi:hypothetical protein